jgi:nitrogen-specific signal transduction histidine kinase
MAIDSTARKSCNDYSNIELPGALKDENGTNAHDAASLTKNSDTQQLLLRAQQNAVNAKEAAMGAINRFYRESTQSEKKASRMVQELDEAIQTALDSAKKSRVKGKKDNGLAALAMDTGDELTDKNAKKDKSRVSKKVLNGGLFSFGSGSSSLFGGKEEVYDAETREEFYRVVMRQSPQMRQLIDDLTEDKTRLKTDKIMAEAKSEIVAARVAVNRAQEEIGEVKEEARRMIMEAEASRKASELVVSQVRQNSVNQIAEEVTRAKEEVKAVKEAADSAIRRAEEEIRKSREQAEAAKNHAQVAITLAQEKIKKEQDQLKVSKLQSEITIKQALEEARIMKEEAEIIRRQAQESMNRSMMESQQAKETMESAKKKQQEAAVIAEKQAYEKFLEEIKKLRQDAEVINKTAYEAIAKAREETRQAHEETQNIKKVCEESIFQAQQEARSARDEAERAKQSLLEVVAQSQEDSRKAGEEAEVSILKANEAMMQAKQDIIALTKKEMSQARQDLENVGDFSIPAENGNGDSRIDDKDKVDSNYVSTVLHEMRTPLHSISGFARLMLEEGVADGNTRKEFLSLMVQQSENLNRLIEDLSGVLTKKTESFSIVTSPVPAQKLVADAINSIQGIAQQKKNIISHNLSASLPDVNADEFRIKQVIVNLLTNAIKFSPEKSPIYVRTNVLEKELLIQVIDRGAGIPEFERGMLFNRRHVSRNRTNEQGEGLGLYICRQIVEAHGGTIWAESIEGKGSTFSFTLPLAK